MLRFEPALKMILLLRQWQSASPDDLVYGDVIFVDNKTTVQQSSSSVVARFYLLFWIFWKLEEKKDLAAPTYLLVHYLP